MTGAVHHYKKKNKLDASFNRTDEHILAYIPKLAIKSHKLTFGNKPVSSPNIWRMPSSGMLRRVAPVRTDVSEERVASIIGVTRIGELEQR
jgi:hypothetical protein